MTVLDDVRELIVALDKRTICDDCITNKLQLSVRQYANQKSRVLAKSPLFARNKDVCSTCGKIKYVIRHQYQQSNNNNLSLTEKIHIPAKQEKNSPRIFSNTPSLNELKAIGFKHIGNWILEGGVLKLNQFDMKKSIPALYAFISETNILYVGKTNQMLAKRLYFYAKPGPTQSTNIRINANLKQAVLDGQSIDIIAFHDDIPKKVGSFILNLSAGLEDDIIRQISPLWNVRK